MPPRTREQLWPYIRCLADRLGLRDWTVNVCDDPPDDSDVNATAHCVYGRKIIILRLSNALLFDSEDKQRQTLCHELIHAHNALMDNFLRRVLNRTQFEAYQITMEYSVDGLADAVAPFMPLPSQVRPSRKRRQC